MMLVESGGQKLCMKQTAHEFASSTFHLMSLLCKYCKFQINLLTLFKFCSCEFELLGVDVYKCFPLHNFNSI